MSAVICAGCGQRAPFALTASARGEHVGLCRSCVSSLQSPALAARGLEREVSRRIRCELASIEWGDEGAQSRTECIDDGNTSCRRRRRIEVAR